MDSTFIISQKTHLQHLAVYYNSRRLHSTLGYKALMDYEKMLSNVSENSWPLHSHASHSKNKYKISQSDLYQLYAYVEKYLGGEGTVILIYPAHVDFSEPLPGF